MNIEDAYVGEGVDPPYEPAEQHPLRPSYAIVFSVECGFAGNAESVSASIRNRPEIPITFDLCKTKRAYFGRPPELKEENRTGYD